MRGLRGAFGVCAAGGERGRSRGRSGRVSEAHGAAAPRCTGPYDHGFDVPHTTVHTGVMRGGTALNIVPHECSFDFEVRHLPGDDPEALLGELEALHRARARARDARDRSAAPVSSIAQLSEIPALDTSAETAIVALVQELTGNSDVGKVSYGTEASQFQRAGIPSVVCGPGSIDAGAQAERVHRARAGRGVRAFLRKLMDRMSLSGRA